MKVLTRYIVWEILKSSAVAMLLLLTLFDLFTFSDELDDIGKGTYGLTEALYFVLLTSATVFYELMPAVALLGSLFALGNLANHNQLIAMRAAGISVFGIVRQTLLAGLIMATVAIGVGEFVAPNAEEQAQTLRANAQNKQVSISSRNGLWLREGQRFINVRGIKEDGGLNDITVYELDDKQQLVQVTHARQAIYLGQKTWRLEEISHSTLATTGIQASQAPSNAGSRPSPPTYSKWLSCYRITYPCATCTTMSVS